VTLQTGLLPFIAQVSLPTTAPRWKHPERRRTVH
jgi:hypothetical protein